jgi:glycosyltransferase involved in cell wall biosynthesis
VSRTILIVAHAHPEESPTGGELAAYQLFQALRERPGIAAHFAAPRLLPGLMGESLRPWAGRTDEWELPSGATDRFLLSQRVPGALAALETLLLKLQPDVVHLHHYMRSGVEAIALARRVLPRARIVLTLHEFLAICAHHGQMLKTESLALCERASHEDCATCFPERSADAFALRRRYVLANLLKTDLLIAPSDFLRERYISWGVPAKRIVLAENYVPFQPRLPARASASGDRRDVFGFFGAISPLKGVKVLIEAFALLRAMPIGAGARLALHGAIAPGSAAFERGFQDSVRLGAPAITWSGRYGRDDLRRLMGEVDWVVVPSIWWENSPLVIQEALMLGRPLILSDIGGMAEKVRNGVEGFTFPVGDARALAETMAFAIPRHAAMLQRDMERETALRLEALLACYGT